MSSMVILTGGGIKSAVTAARYAKDAELILLFVNYGQASSTSDMKAIEALAKGYTTARVARVDLPHVRKLSAGIEHMTASAGKVGGGSSTATDQDGLSPTTLRGLMPVMISVGLQTAIRVGASGVALGLSRHCDATHVGMPGIEGRGDARREFIHACDIMSEMVLRPRARIRIECPLMDVSYAEIIKLAQRFQAPLEKTWTCLRAGLHPCGTCESCLARARAFTEAGYNDPALTPARV